MTHTTRTCAFARTLVLAAALNLGTACQGASEVAQTSSGPAASSPPGPAAPTAPPGSPGPRASSSPSAPLGDEETEPTDTQATGEPDTVVFGFIKANTAMSLTYDKVDYLEEPCQALRGVDPGEIVAAVRTCFSNTNPRERTLEVSPQVIVIPYSAETQIEPVGIAELSRFYGTQDDDVPPGAEVWKITLAGGDLVVGLEQFPVGVLDQ